MAGYSAIADASESFLEMLRDRIGSRADVIDIDRNAIVLSSPNDVEADSNVRLSLYMYKISKNGHLSSSTRQHVGDNTYEDPPLPLDLHYLLTAYPSQNQADDVAKARDQHSVIGLALQVLHDNSIIEGDELKGSLAGEQSLRVSMVSDGGTEIEQVWKTFVDEPFQPSVIYEVSPVLIESTKQKEIAHVTDRSVDVSHKPEEEDTEYEYQDDDDDSDGT